MKKENLRLFLVEFSLLIFALLAIIFSGTINRLVVSVALLFCMFISFWLIKVDKLNSINSKQLIILLSSFGVIYISLIYILGIFIGFYESTVKLSIWSIFNYIIPYVIIIVSSEMIRKRVLLKENKKSKLIILIIMVMLDVYLSINIYNLKGVSDYFTLIGFVIFSSIANNLLYNYIILKYRNEKAIIIYRIITTLYMYIIPIAPNIYVFFDSIIKMVVPYVIYIIMEKIYNRNQKVVLSIEQKRKENALGVALCVVVAIIIMLVSCKFKYGILTIGSGSMTGTLNKGDVILYEKYNEKDKIKTGDIIVFINDGVKVVHRVVDQKTVGDEARYYTKGDTNQHEDDGYREREDIVGNVKLRIPYIGYLTLWINDIF